MSTSYVRDAAPQRSTIAAAGADWHLATFLTEPFVRAGVLGLGSLNLFDPSPDDLRLYWASRQLYLHQRESWNVLVHEYVLQFLLHHRPLRRYPTRRISAARRDLLGWLDRVPPADQLVKDESDA